MDRLGITNYILLITFIFLVDKSNSSSYRRYEIKREIFNDTKFNKQPNIIINKDYVNTSSNKDSKVLDNSKSSREKSNLVKTRYENITKSATDPRFYRGLELSNHMKVLLVSDPNTEKSAASLTVNVGAINGPKDLYGLPHFCEHMLFMGTEKYPQENDYFVFVKSNGGSSNAGTAMDYTHYYFDVHPDSLTQALDRFAQFFIAPLFSENATNREINAVHSEYEKNIPNDNRRLNQLFQHLSSPDSPYNTFTTGNLETLRDVPNKNNVNIRDKLIEFYEKWYSSNIMNLAVLGKESLDELENMVVPLFSEVKNKNVKLSEWTTHPFKDENLRTKVYVSPIKDIRRLVMFFPIEDLSKYYKSQPADYISHLLSHQSLGSISSVLKARGWSGNLEGGRESVYRGVNFYHVSTHLTEEGLNHVDDIIKLVFQYLNMLKKEGPQKWVHDEQRKILQMKFRYKDIESPQYYIDSLSLQLHEYPFESVLSADYSLEWRPDLIQKVWKNLVPEKIRVYVTTKKFDKNLNQTEYWYGTKYRVDKIPDATIRAWKNAGLNPELRMPEKNELIPSKFDLYPMEESNEYPIIIKDTPLVRVWHKQDDKFLFPKTNLRCNFFSPLIYLDPSNLNLVVVFLSLLRDSLNDYTYIAHEAGLGWGIYANEENRITLSIEGYSEKQHLLLKKIMDKMTNFKIDIKRFNIIKDIYEINLKNFAADEPFHTVSHYYFNYLLNENFWSKQERLDKINELTVEKLKAFVPEIFSKMRIECLIHGNVNKRKSLDLISIIEDSLTTTFKTSPLLPSQLFLNREVLLEDGSQQVYEVKNDIHKSSCIGLYLQCGLSNIENLMKLRLLALILNEPTFNILRTKEQLGYSVRSILRKMNSMQGLAIVIQSNRHPNYLETRIEVFLETMMKQISELSEENVLKFRETLAARISEKPIKLSVLTSKYWDELVTQQYYFNRTNEELAYVKTITKNDVLEYFKENFGSKSEKRKKLTVKIISVAEGGAGKNAVEKISDDLLIQDVTMFKRTHRLSSLLPPYINFTKKR